MAKFDIGIVIVNYNVKHFLTQCLHSIQNSKTNNLKIETWVVDNASVDGSVFVLENEYSWVNIIANKQNFGFSKANNQVLNLLDCTYTLLLNPDTVLEEDTLQMCFDFMEAHQNSGALGVRMIDGSGTFLPESKRQIPDLWNSFCKLTYLSDLFPKSTIFSGYNLGFLPEMETNKIDVLCGAFMFIRSNVLGDVGFLDEAFFMYGEDIDLSYRIKKAGFDIYYYPKTSIIHYKGESTKKSSLNYVKTFYGAMHIYVNKHYGNSNARLFSILIKIAIWFRASLSVLGKLFKNWMPQTIDFCLIWYSLVIIKFIWAGYYFSNSQYYDSTNIDTTVGLYSIIWVFGLYFVGHYDRSFSFSKTLYGIATGTAFILIGYALLPEYLRTSRAIILIGAIIATIICTITMYILNLIFLNKNNKKTKQNLVIVAFKDSAEKLKRTLAIGKVQFENIYVVSPDSSFGDTYYTNNITALPQIAKDLKIDEIIYSNENMTMKEIIGSMTKMESRVSFKIGGDDSLSIIGSNSKDHQGQFYSVNLAYKIGENGKIKRKRIVDVLLSVLICMFSPIILMLCNFNLQLFANIFGVLDGSKTWVGYGGALSDFVFLPSIPSGVIKYPNKSRAILVDEDYFKKENALYAREYSITNDLVIIWNNIYKLANS